MICCYWFCGVDGSDENDSYFCTESVKRLVFRIVYVFCIIKKFEPVSGFVSFFKCDLEFRNEVGFAVCIT